MKFKIYKLEFSTALHLGNRRLSDSGKNLYADTIFSALCHEALLSDGEAGIKRLVDLVNDNKIRISDAMPYIGDEYYVPKPMICVEFEESSDSTVKKAAKNLEYIPYSRFDKYIDGSINIIEEREKIKRLGSVEYRTMACVPEIEDTKPYQVGTFRFSDDSGFYVIIGYMEDEDLYLIEDLLISLGYSGIGGKRSSGLGKFQLKFGECESLTKNIKIDSEDGIYELLSIAISDEENLKDIINDSSYKLIRRGGFVSSYNYSDSFRRKKDIFLFESGSVFRKTFNGVLADLNSGGRHPVYRYAKPMFLEVRS